MSTSTAVPGIPFPLVASEGSAWSVDATEGTVRVTAAPHSDLFVDPGTGGNVAAETLLNAVTLLGDLPDGDFQFRAHVSVDFAATFDAGVLLIWFDEGHWAKLCFEFSPAGDPMIVSVVTRDVSDDANSLPIDGRSAWLRVSRVGRVFAYHASVDGTTWHLVRAFALDAPRTTARIGLEAQSPTGDGCAVTFAHLSFLPERLADLRDGS